MDCIKTPPRIFTSRRFAFAIGFCLTRLIFLVLVFNPFHRFIEMLASSLLSRSTAAVLGRRAMSAAAAKTKVAVLGAGGGIGQPLSMLLKLSPVVDELACYDIVGTPGVAADLSHVSVCCVREKRTVVMILSSLYAVQADFGPKVDRFALLFLKFTLFWRSSTHFIFLSPFCPFALSNRFPLPPK